MFLPVDICSAVVVGEWLCLPTGIYSLGHSSVPPDLVPGQTFFSCLAISELITDLAREQS